MAVASSHLRVDCPTPGSAPGTTLGNEYGRTLPLPLAEENVAVAESVPRFDM